MLSLQVISRTTRQFVAVAAVVALSGLMAGCTGESAPAPGASGAAPGASASPSPASSKKAAPEAAGGKGKSMPDIPKG
jgi:hypothetical protein